MDSCFGLDILCHSFSLAQIALLALPVMPALWPTSHRFALGVFAEEGRKMSANARLDPLLCGYNGYRWQVTDDDQDQHHD